MKLLTVSDFFKTALKKKDISNERVVSGFVRCGSYSKVYFDANTPMDHIDSYLCFLKLTGFRADRDRKYPKSLIVFDEDKVIRRRDIATKLIAANEAIIRLEKLHLVKTYLKHADVTSIRF
jgi:hypothetical protein